MSYISTKKLIVTICCILLCTYTYGQGCPPNIDFEKGTFDNWKFAAGTCCPISTPTITPPGLNIHVLTSGSGTDPYGGFPVVAPGGGQYSFRLGNDLNGAAERATYYIRVPASTPKFLVVFKYAVVLQNPFHQPNEQPRFDVSAYDSATGDVLTCANFSFVASSALPGFQLSTVPGNADVWFKPWGSASLDLTAYKGKTVAISFATGDCALGMHFGYAYVDIDCKAFSPTNISCNGAPTVTLKAPPGFQSYEWRDATFTTSLGNSEVITLPTPPQSTTYNVIIHPYPGYGCSDTIPIQVVIANIQLKLPKDTVACNGADVLLDANAWNSNAKPFKYQWSPATGLSCTDCRNPVANLQETTTYTIVVTDTNGCTKTDTIRVNRVKRVFANIQLPADTVCQYAHTVLKNIATNNPATAAHYWNVDTNGHIYTGNSTATITAWWGTPGLRRIIVRTNDEYCNVWDTAYIYVKPGPYAYFDLKPNVCLNEEFALRPASTDAWYYWSIEGKNEKDTNYKSPVKISYNTLGRKNISLRVKGFNGCMPPPYDTFVTVREFPVTDIFISEKEICYGDTATVNTIENIRYIYGWTPVYSFVSNSEHSARVHIERPQMVYLEVSNEWGCRTYDSAYIMPQHCCNVYFPDAFTPNGDGLNDRFKPITVGHHKIQSFMIANRWGKIIFNSTDQYTGWDGTYKGEKQDYGMYFYYMKYDCTDGETVDKKGSFLLIR